MALTDDQFLGVIDATPLVSIDLIVRDTAGRILLGKRINRPAQGFWFVPGGRIRKNEPIRDALLRISAREIGHPFTLDEVLLLGAYDHIYDDNYLGRPGVNTHYVVLGFAGRLPEGTVVQGDDQHDGLEWWDVESLLTDDSVHPNTKRYFE